MVWSISISSGGWEQIRTELEKMSSEKLAKAIGDFNFEMHRKDRHHRGFHKWEKLVDLPHDILVDTAFECVEITNTCENGGFIYWIDPDGCHTFCLHDWRLDLERGEIVKYCRGCGQYEDPTPEEVAYAEESILPVDVPHRFIGICSSCRIREIVRDGLCRHCIELDSHRRVAI